MLDIIMLAIGAASRVGFWRRASAESNAPGERHQMPILTPFAVWSR
jgi:hypothetical protein